MSNLVVHKPEAWATPEEVRDTIDRLLEDAKEMRMVSISIVGESIDGKVYTRSSRTENKFAVAAQFMMMAMKLLGFLEKGVD